MVAEDAARYKTEMEAYRAKKEQVKRLPNMTKVSPAICVHDESVIPFNLKKQSSNRLRRGFRCLTYASWITFLQSESSQPSVIRVFGPSSFMHYCREVRVLKPEARRSSSSNLEITLEILSCGVSFEKFDGRGFLKFRCKLRTEISWERIT